MQMKVKGQKMEFCVQNISKTESAIILKFSQYLGPDEKRIK